MTSKGDAGRYEFERFVADTSDGLVRTAYLLTWDLPAAEDLVQDCLSKVARRWPRVRAMEHPAAYARRILVNLVLDGAKRRARHQAELEQRAGPTFERGDEGVAQEMSSVEARFVLVRALGALAPRQRATLVLRYFDDLTEVATAEVMGCSVGTVKSTASRALDHLRAELAPTVSDSPPRDTPPLVTQHGTHQRSEPT